MIKRVILSILLLIYSVNIYSQKTKEFRHVLLYKWKKDVQNAKKIEFLKLFEELPDKIEGLSEISIHNISKSSSGFDVFIKFKFSTKSILKKYQNHKDHNKIVIMANTIICDYSYFQY